MVRSEKQELNTYMVDSLLNECRIEVGRVVIALICDSAEYAASVRDYFGSSALVREQVIEREFTTKEKKHD